MTCSMTISLGVYALGAVGPQERARLEAHLPGCPECQAELVGFVPMPALLDRVPQSERPAPHLPVPVARQRTPLWTRWRARRPGRMAAGLAAAAVCLAAAVGFTAGYWLTPSPAGQPSARTVTFTGTNPAAHVVATAALTSTSWGTSIQLRLQGIPLNVECRLIAHSVDGASEVTGVWDAWAEGPVTVPASAGWLTSDIASLDVVAGTKKLVTISTVRAQK